MRKSSRDRKPSAAFVYAVQNELQSDDLKLLKRPRKIHKKPKRIRQNAEEDSDSSTSQSETGGIHYDFQQPHPSVIPCIKLNAVKPPLLCNCCKDVKAGGSSTCNACFADTPESLAISPFRQGVNNPLTQGGRELAIAVNLGRVPKFKDGYIKEPFGCKGFHCIRRFLSEQDLDKLLTEIGSTPNSNLYMTASQLTGSAADRSKKVYCCTPEQMRKRGGRYLGILRPHTCHSLINYETIDGQNLNEVVPSLFPVHDPFVTSTEILCQQLAWHYEDLDLHCDKDRQDKTHEKQPPGSDGVGDRITSLTLRRGCWLFLRETSNHANCFALHLEPGDIYTMSGPARWRWQHGIFLDEPPLSDHDCRISILWRLLEEYPE
eukprot:m.194686 g.194686  ORF g.194686 m.194686 type:complete len:376 (-) comp18657_c0_seq5:1110-2237(-)